MTMKIGDRVLVKYVNTPCSLAGTRNLGATGEIIDEDYSYSDETKLVRYEDGNSGWYYEHELELVK
jgi:hypothetical protein